MVEIKGKVLFDRSHGQKYGFKESHEAWSFRHLKSLLKKLGIECYDLNEGPITQDKLKYYDVVLLYSNNVKTMLESQKSFTNEELAEVKNYVWNGDGSLLLMFKYPQVHYLFPGSKPNLDQIGKEFGMKGCSYHLGKLDDVYGSSLKVDEMVEENYFSGSLQFGGEGSFRFEDHPITRGLKSLYSTFDLLPLDVDATGGAIPLIFYEGYFEVWGEKLVMSERGNFPIFAINKNYRVASLSTTPDIFSDLILEDSWNRGHNPDFGPAYDNQEFAENLFSWLCGIEQEPSKSKKPKRVPSALRYP